MLIISAFKKTTNALCKTIISAQTALRTFYWANKQASLKSGATQKRLLKNRRKAFIAMNSKIRVIATSINLNPAFNTKLRESMNSLNTTFAAPAFA